MKQGALKGLGEEKLRAFLRQVRHEPAILACRLANEALDAGVPLAALFTAEEGYSATVATAKGAPDGEVVICFGCQAGPEAGDGGEWTVDFAPDGSVRQATLTGWWLS